MADLAIISALLNDLRCHPVWGANEGVALAHCIAQLCCHTKVSYLHLSSLCQQDVATLDVAMHLRREAHMVTLLLVQRPWDDNCFPGQLNYTKCQVYLQLYAPVRSAETRLIAFA